MRVTGSELVGLVPKSVLVDAGKYFLEKQRRSVGISERELIHIAVRTLGLDELAPFDPDKKVIEYLLEDKSARPLAYKTLTEFADSTASETPVPGGGSASAYVGVLGVALGTMVANLSSHKKGWDDKITYFSEWAEKGQAIKDKLLRLVDADTQAYNKIIEAIRMPKATDVEKQLRKEALNAATKGAIEAPMEVMRVSLSSMELIKAMATHGNPNSVSDAGVGAICVRTAIEGAGLNVKINCVGFEDQAYVANAKQQVADMLDQAKVMEQEILAIVEKLME